MRESERGREIGGDRKRESNRQAETERPRDRERCREKLYFSALKITTALLFVLATVYFS